MPPPAPTLASPPRRSEASPAVGQPERAERLLAAMASIRRSGRLRADRPVELSSLTGSQLELVRLVRRRPHVSVAQAADELRLAPNTVSTLVRQLTDRGMLVRRVDSIDRRVARLQLTPGIRRKVGAFRDRRVAMLVSAMTTLSAADQRSLAGAVAVLERLADQLQQEAPNG